MVYGSCATPANLQGRPLRDHFVAFRAPMTFVRFPDDPIAPRANVRELMSFYACAPQAEVEIAPAEAAVAEIGHFGFFRESCAGLWSRTLDWLA